MGQGTYNQDWLGYYILEFSNPGSFDVFSLVKWEVNPEFSATTRASVH